MKELNIGMNSLTSSEFRPQDDPFSLTGYQQLDARALRLEQLSSLIFAGVVVFGLVIAAAIVGWFHPWTNLFSWAVVMFVAGLLLWGIYVYDPLAHKNFGYKFSGSVMLIRSGVWWRNVRYMPLTRVQHVDVSVGPMQRRFGLATLLIHTAGTGLTPFRINGLDETLARSIRDDILSRIEPEEPPAQTQTALPPDPAFEHRTDAPETQPPPDAPTTETPLPEPQLPPEPTEPGARA